MTEQDTGKPFVPDSAVCPICHNTIRLADESFLELCYHRFCFHCIRKWTDTQAEQHDNGSCGSFRPSFTCPLCKGNYSYILYDVLDAHSFRQHFVPGGNRPGSHGQSEVYALNSAQRRRRGLYFAPPSEAHHHCGGDDTAASASSPAASPNYELAPAASTANTTTTAGRKARPMRLGPAALRTHHKAWLKRELQALLLQEDVSLVLAHVLASADEAEASEASKRNNTAKRGRLASPSAAAKNKRRQIGSASQEQRQGVQNGGEQGGICREAWVRAVEKSSRPFLVDDRQARILAAEFAAFCGSGLSVSDYDKADELRQCHQRQQQILLLGDRGNEGPLEGESSARPEKGAREQDEEEGRDEAAAARCSSQPSDVAVMRDVVAYLSDDGADLPETDDAASGDFWSSGDER